MMHIKNLLKNPRVQLLLLVTLLIFVGLVAGIVFGILGIANKAASENTATTAATGNANEERIPTTTLPSTPTMAPSSLRRSTPTQSTAMAPSVLSNIFDTEESGNM